MNNNTTQKPGMQNTSNKARKKSILFMDLNSSPLTTSPFFPLFIFTALSVVYAFVQSPWYLVISAFLLVTLIIRNVALKNIGEIKPSTRYVYIFFNHGYFATVYAAIIFIFFGTISPLIVSVVPSIVSTILLLFLIIESIRLLFSRNWRLLGLVVLQGFSYEFVLSSLFI